MNIFRQQSREHLLSALEPQKPQTTEELLFEHWGNNPRKHVETLSQAVTDRINFWCHMPRIERNVQQAYPRADLKEAVGNEAWVKERLAMLPAGTTIKVFPLQGKSMDVYRAGDKTEVETLAWKGEAHGYVFDYPLPPPMVRFVIGRNNFMIDFDDEARPLLHDDEKSVTIEFEPDQRYAPHPRDMHIENAVSCMVATLPARYEAFVGTYGSQER